MRFMTLSRARQLYVGIVLLVVLPLVFVLMFYGQLYGFYLHQFVRPSLERKFGFSSDVVNLSGLTSNDRVFAITRVVPGGRLEMAGCRAGDIPVGFAHGFETGFLQDLLWVRSGHPVEFEVLAAADVGKGPTAWRKVRLAPQN
jgi:hypothetical protein